MSDLITNFANRNRSPGLLTQIGAVAADQVQQRRAALLQQQQEAAYQNALSTFMQDPSPENRVAVLEAGRPLGRFEEAEKTFSTYDTARREAEAKQLANVLGPLYARDFEMAAGNMDRLADAYANSGDQESAQEWRMFSEAVRQGRGDEVTATLSLQGSFTEEGKRVLDSLNAVRTDRREEMKATSDFIDSAVERTFDSPEEQVRQKELAGKMPNPELAQLSIDMGSVVSPLQDGTMDANNVNTAVRAWRAQYMNETQDFRKVNQQAGIVRQAAYRALTQTALGTEAGIGVADLALINAFQRMIDDATVRESDIQNINAARAFGEDLLARLEGFQSGDRLSPEQRRAMLRTANQIATVYDEQEQDTRSVMAANAKAIEEASGQENILYRIAGDELFNFDEPEQQYKEVKEVILGVLPSASEDFRGISTLDELAQLRDASGNLKYANLLVRLGVIQPVQGDF